MKLLGLLLLPLPALACDWQVAETVDSFTDARTCIIRSARAAIGFSVTPENIRLLTGSAYGDLDALQVRIDENAPIVIGRRGRHTSAYDSSARDAIAQIRSGQRLRVRFLDHPNMRAGDAPICDLPQKIDQCQTGAPSLPHRPPRP